ncbi:MAG: CDP-glycerol glycerophosphotransferase family protein [Actinomycetota bacterium]|nr:CDP-glycerol glycerophosphotransferase family protein [Actinomycetota bacterium]
MREKLTKVLGQSAAIWTILTAGVLLLCASILFGPTGKSILPICVGCLVAGILCIAILIWTRSGEIFPPIIQRAQLALAEKGDRRRDARIARDAKAGAPIKVGLLLDLPSLWTMFESLYDELKNDERFEVTIVAMPDVNKGKLVGNSASEMLTKAGVPHEVLYQNGRLGNLSSYGFHYVFPSRHYTYIRPKKYVNWRMRGVARMCHISYGVCIFSGGILEIVMNFEELQHYSIVFSETAIHSSLFEARRDKYPDCHAKIELVGSSKFDAIHPEDFACPPSNYKQVILYAPRWTPDGNACTFLDYYECFFDLVEQHPDVKYILRPHPLMRNRFRGRVIPEEEWDAIFDRFNDYDNAEVDENPDYRAAFKQATVFVSDISSLIPEFLLTEKPIIYAQKRWQFNEFGKAISEGCYHCHNWDEISNVLDSLREGNHPKREAQRRVIDEYSYLGEESAASRMKQVIIRDYRELAGDGDPA